ncbi:hypothetical protein LTR95_019236 [Oleoguttula sp. CCFEE 5521]
MTIIHIVLFEFKSSASEAQVSEVHRTLHPILPVPFLTAPQICNRMAGLPSICVHPTTQKSYITSHGGGRDNSPENQAGGFTHGFVCEFENQKDRDYYLHEDPKHVQFVKDIGEHVANVRVVDYEKGVF